MEMNVSESRVSKRVLMNKKEIQGRIDPTCYQRKMLRLLGFPKAKPESGLGCPYFPASRLSVQSEGAGGPRRAGWRVPGECAAVGSDGSQPALGCASSVIERREKQDCL